MPYVCTYLPQNFLNIYPDIHSSISPMTQQARISRKNILKLACQGLKVLKRLFNHSTHPDPTHKRSWHGSHPTPYTWIPSYKRVEQGCTLFYCLSKPKWPCSQQSKSGSLIVIGVAWSGKTTLASAPDVGLNWILNVFFLSEYRLIWILQNWTQSPQWTDSHQYLIILGDHKCNN